MMVDDAATLPEPARFCRDCKWRHMSWSDRILLGPRHASEFATCLHHSALLADLQRLAADVLVTGTVRKLGPSEYTYCSVNRLHDCGAEGKFWESRQ